MTMRMLWIPFVALLLLAACGESVKQSTSGQDTVSEQNVDDLSEEVDSLDTAEEDIQNIDQEMEDLNLEDV